MTQPAPVFTAEVDTSLSEAQLDELIAELRSLEGRIGPIKLRMNGRTSSLGDVLRDRRRLRSPADYLPVDSSVEVRARNIERSSAMEGQVLPEVERLALRALLAGRIDDSEFLKRCEG